MIQGLRQQEQTEGGKFEEDRIDDELRFGPDFIAFRFARIASRHASRQWVQVLYSDEVQGRPQRLQEVEDIVDNRVEIKQLKQKCTKGYKITGSIPPYRSP